jgi:hypothetical protein
MLKLIALTLALATLNSCHISLPKFSIDEPALTIGAD